MSLRLTTVLVSCWKSWAASSTAALTTLAAGKFLSRCQHCGLVCNRTNRTECVPGFALPLKEEHKDFLIKALIPLHKAGTPIFG